MDKTIRIVCGAFLFAIILGCDIAAENVQQEGTEKPSLLTSQKMDPPLGQSSSSQITEGRPLSGSADHDSDNDLYPSSVDCDDHNEMIHPGAYEWCDSIDNDCNGETDEPWQKMFAGFIGEPCLVTTVFGCTNTGIWSCDYTHDWITCNAPPSTPTQEKCNGIDDDCNGEADTDRWPELGEPCEIDYNNCTYSGFWSCDPYSELPYCSAEDAIGTNETCPNASDG